jgi:hypothetical protein
MGRRTDGEDAVLVGAYGIDEGLAARDVDAFLEQARELRVLDGR